MDDQQQALIDQIEQVKPDGEPTTPSKAHKFASVASGMTCGVLLLVLGIPLLIAMPLIGIILLIIGPLVIISQIITGSAARKGICPYCKAKDTHGEPPAFDCKVCKQRIVIRDNKFYRVDQLTDDNETMAK